MANNYDRVFKENIESLLLPLLRKILGLVPPKLVPVDAKLQVTQEAEMDHIRRVVHEDSNQDYGLQIEFHVTDEDLRKRNLLHYALFHNITDLPLRQIVIYGGMGVPNKIHLNALELKGLALSYEVIILRNIPKDVFLESQIPEEVILAILCDFGEMKPEQVVRQILLNLRKILRRSSRIKKYQKQLLVLSRLRKMELIVKTEMEAITFHYDIETDGLYLQGVEQGLEQGLETKAREVLLQLWATKEFSLEKMALLVNVSLDKVVETISNFLQSEGLSEVEATQAIEAHQTKFIA